MKQKSLSIFYPTVYNKAVMPSFGTLKVDSTIFLAPMAGISDLPFRLLNRSFGCGLAFTEMISSNSLVRGSRNTMRMISSTPEDSPLGIQILGANPEILKEALDKLSQNSCDIIDFNAACPAKKVISKGEGAALLREPLKLQKILEVIVRRAAAPVTVKIRSGWDLGSVNALETALRAQDAGVKGVFIHGRTRIQGYGGTVDYDLIRRVKERLDIPVIASGDALAPHLIMNIFGETGCDAVAVARGSLGNPWIFRQTSEYIRNGSTGPEPGVYEILRVMKEHLDSNIAFYGERTGVVLFRKFFSWYTRGMAIKELKVKAFRAGTRHQMLGLIDAVATAPVGSSSAMSL